MYPRAAEGPVNSLRSTASTFAKKHLSYKTNPGNLNQSVHLRTQGQYCTLYGAYQCISLLVLVYLLRFALTTLDGPRHLFRYMPGLLCWLLLLFRRILSVASWGLMLQGPYHVSPVVSKISPSVHMYRSETHWGGYAVHAQASIGSSQACAVNCSRHKCYLCLTSWTQHL